MGPGQQRPVGPGQPRPTGSLTDVGPLRSPRPTGGLGQRRRPRPTHRWDPQRGVVPLNPNAPAQFVPPPTPAVLDAFMQGMARRQGNGQNAQLGPLNPGPGGGPREWSNRGDMPMPIPLAQMQSVRDPQGNVGLSSAPGRAIPGTPPDMPLQHFWPRQPIDIPVYPPLNRIPDRTQRY